jgi:hypothetical protein
MTTKSNARYPPKQHRMAEHIEQPYEKKGYARNRAWAIAWSTIRKYLGEGPDSKRVIRIFL